MYPRHLTAAAMIVRTMGLLLTVGVAQVGTQAVDPPVVAGIVNSASNMPVASPGCLISIYGSDLASARAVVEDLPLPVSLEGTTVTIAGKPAPLLFVSRGQVNVQVPFEITLGRVPLVVSTPAGQSNAFPVDVLSTSPGIFTRNRMGQGKALYLDSSFQLADAVNPGDALTLFATGLGITDPRGTTGTAGVSSEPLQRVTSPLELQIGDVIVEPFFAGLTPHIAGVYQVNFVVPDNMASNRLILRAAGRQSNTTTIRLATPAHAASTPLTISTSGIPSATAGLLYWQDLAAAGGTPPLEWRLASPGLPDGISLDTHGRIWGSPLIPGLYNFGAQVQDASAASARASRNWTLEVLDPASEKTVLWSSDFETGNTAQWYLPSGGSTEDAGGGVFLSGVAQSRVTRERARSGSWSLEMTIQAPPESGVRMFRWKEPQAHPYLVYSVWYYFPTFYSTVNYWNILQWKSKHPSGEIDPFFVVDVQNFGRAMYLSLFDWQTRHNYTQTIKSIPIAQWFKVDTAYQCAGDDSGRVAVWQDGVLLFDLTGVQTRYPTGDCQWSIDNYSDAITPSPAVIYIDDAKISLAPAALPR